MALQASFTAYGANIDELKEAAYEQAVKFFRVLDEDIVLVDLHARPTVKTAEGEPTRWRAHVVMRTREDGDD